MKEILSRAIESGGRLRVRSALNPALWLCAIVALPVLSAVAFSPSPSLFLQVVGCTPIFIASFGYLFLLFFDRDKLQSEDFQIRKKSLEMIEQSDGLAVLKIDDVKMIANPNDSEEG